MKHIYTLKEGESCTFYNGVIIVVHPDRPPKIIHSDGVEEEMRLYGTGIVRVDSGVIEHVPLSEFYDDSNKD